MKVLLRAPSTEAELNAYLNELDLTSTLRHPSVVMLLAACLTLPRLSIVLEFAERGGLDTILYSANKAKGSVTLGRPLLLRMAVSIGKGLAFLHSSDPPVIHRDLKPANCFVFSDPAVVKVGCVALLQFAPFLLHVVLQWYLGYFSVRRPPLPDLRPHFQWSTYARRLRRAVS